jgi:hypothetical protein
MNAASPVMLRRTRSARIVEHAGGISVYPEPHATPVLPAGWAPLTPAEQESLLRACDEQPSACRLRLGSLWEAESEYRVYCLGGEMWGGGCVATVHTRLAGEAGGSANLRLLAFARSAAEAAAVAGDFLNWELEADAAEWRVSLAPVRG